MKNVNKYERQYFMPPVCEYDWAKKDHIEKAPIWCSVDLRDGNQALIEPMSLDENLNFPDVSGYRNSRKLMLVSRQLLRQNLFSGEH